MKVMKSTTTIMRVALLGVVMTIAACCVQADESSSFQTLGPFSPAPALAVYIAGDGKPLTAHLSISQGSRAAGDRIMIREFDPAERLVLWKYIEPDGKHVGAQSDWFDADMQLNDAGVYQIRVVAGARNANVTVALSRPAGYGVSFQNGDYSAWPNQPSRLYAFIPPHAEELDLSLGPVHVTDETGAEKLNMASADPYASSTAAITKTGVVWTFDFPDPKKWKLHAWGIPLILCPTPESARAIHASVDTLPDGTVVTWKFQARIAELLPKLLDPKIVGTADKLIVPRSSRKDQWLKDPLRNQYLLNRYCAYSGVEQALRNQNVDPASDWSGATGSYQGKPLGWIDLEKRAPPLNRWDRLKSVDGLWSSGTWSGLWAGASPCNSDADGLAVAATLNDPINPYYGSKALLYRTTAAALRDLMTVGEDEVWRGVGADNNDADPGAMSFSMEMKTLPPYAMVAPLMPPDIRAVWTEGLRHLVDRSYPDALSTCRNQSSHYVAAFEQFAEGSGDPHYQEMAHAYAARYIQGMSPAGYGIENTGPDATYCGIQHYHMALYYRMTGDPAMAEAIRKSYRFFNYTVAPEPDGTVVGASNFAHRTAGGFDVEQYNGARGVADDLPEVGLWAPKAGSPEEQTKKVSAVVDSITASLDHPQGASGATMLAHYLYAHIPVNRTGVFPANETGRFTRDIGGELVAVKRAAYYLAVYLGHPAPDPFYIRSKERLRQPLPLDAENTGGLADAHGLIEASGRAHFQCTPFLGGGLSLFQTPAYGNAVIAANWSPLVHNGLVAVRADGARYWEDYFATKYQLDSDNGTLAVSGQLEGEPIRYTRTYRFDPNDVEVHLTLTADKDVSFTRLFETIPIAEGAVKSRGVLISAAGQSSGKVSAATVQLRDNTGAGVDIVFDDGPQSLQIQPNGLILEQNKLQIGRVEVELPATMKAGQTVELTYRLVPISGGASAVTQ